MIRVAINGFGRIGRNTFKAGFGRKDLKNIEWVAINDLTSPDNLAYLLQYDSVYGKYDKKVSILDGHLNIGGKKVKVLNEKDPAKLPWKQLKIDVVLECTGVFTDKKKASAHLKAGAKRVIISAPSKGGAQTYLLGVNAQKYDKKETIIDNGSCTTNCVGPVMAVMHSAFGVEKALMTTIHGYTATQALVDAPHKKDFRRGRAAAQNIVPTSTGAAIATTKALPDLKGSFDGMAVRVPVISGSLSDFTMVLKKTVSAEDVNNAFIKASKNPLYKGVLQVNQEPLVSTDILKNPASSIVDLTFTKVVGGNLVKILAWYDNEWGYSNRLVEMVKQIAK